MNDIIIEDPDKNDGNPITAKEETAARGILEVVGDDVKQNPYTATDVRIANEDAVARLENKENEVGDAVTMGVVKAATESAAFDMNALIGIAVREDKMEMLRELLDLKHREDDRLAKEEFDSHFSQMQGEFVAVKKSAENKHLHSKYAKIEDIQAVYTPIISKHGFSYSWREEVLEGGGKRTILEISGYKYTKETFWDVPKLDPIKSNAGGSVQNAVQVAGSMSTYGRRYSFVNGFGVIMEGEDSDGHVDGTGGEWANEVLSLQSCANMNELYATWSPISEKARGNQSAIKYLSGIFGECKKQLGG